MNMNEKQIMTIVTAVLSALNQTEVTTTETTTTTAKKAVKRAETSVFSDFDLYVFANTYKRKNPKTDKMETVTVLLTAINGKVEKSDWKRLKRYMLDTHGTRYNKYMGAFVTYPENVSAYRETLKTEKQAVHKKAPTWYRKTENLN